MKGVKVFLYYVLGSPPAAGAKGREGSEGEQREEKEGQRE